MKHKCLIHNKIHWFVILSETQWSEVADPALTGIWPAFNRDYHLLRPDASPSGSDRQLQIGQFELITKEYPLQKRKSYYIIGIINSPAKIKVAKES